MTVVVPIHEPVVMVTPRLTTVKLSNTCKSSSHPASWRV